MASVDATVMGAGIFGLSIAWELLRKGMRVRVIDPAGVGGGASGGIVGALAPHVPENWNEKKEIQLQSLLMAEEWWAEVAAIGGGDPGYCRSGRLQPLPDDAAVRLAKEREAGARAFWKDQAEWRIVSSVDELAPISPTGFWVYDSLSALLHPRRACDALAKAITRLGAEICPEGKEEGAIVWASGAAGLKDLNGWLGQNYGHGIKGQAALLRHDAVGRPQVFAGGVHIVPHSDGTVAIGSTTEREYSDLSNDYRVNEIVEKARVFCPELRCAECISLWSGLRPRWKTRAPILGRWPGRNRHFFANGGFKIGFGMAPCIARMMSDLIFENTDRIPAQFKLASV